MTSRMWSRRVQARDPEPGGEGYSRGAGVASFSRFSIFFSILHFGHDFPVVSIRIGAVSVDTHLLF